MQVQGYSQQPMSPPVRCFEAFFEEKNIQWWHIVGGLLLLSGVIGFIHWQWNLIGRQAILLLLLTIMSGLYLAGWRLLTTLRLSGLALLTISSLLVPLNLVAINKFSLLGLSLEWVSFGILTSAVCCIIYGFTLYRLREKVFTYLAGGAFILLTGFVLRAFRFSYNDFPIAYAILSFVLILMAWMNREKKYLEQPLIIMSDVMQVISYGWVLMDCHYLLSHAGLSRAIALSAVGMTQYLTSGYLYERTFFLYVFSGFLLAFGGLILWRFEEGAVWHQFGVVLATISAGLLMGGWANVRFLKRGYFQKPLVTVAASVVSILMLVVFGRGLMLLATEMIPSDPEELLNLLIVQVISASIYITMAKLYRKPSILYGACGMIGCSWLFVAIWCGVPCSLWGMWLASGMALSVIASMLLQRWEALRRHEAVNDDGTDSEPSYAAPLWHSTHVMAAIAAIAALAIWIHIECSAASTVSLILTLSLVGTFFSFTALTRLKCWILYIAIGCYALAASGLVFSVAFPQQFSPGGSEIGHFTPAFAFLSGILAPVFPLTLAMTFFGAILLYAGRYFSRSRYAVLSAAFDVMAFVIIIIFSVIALKGYYMEVGFRISRLALFSSGYFMYLANLILATGLLVIGARRHTSSLLSIISVIAAVGAYSILIHAPFFLPRLALMPGFEVNYGLAYIPLTAVMITGGGIFLRRNSPYALHWLTAGSVVALLSIIAQLFYVPGFGWTVVATLWAYALIAVISFLQFSKSWILHIAITLFTCGFTYALNRLGLYQQQIALGQMMLALAMIGYAIFYRSSGSLWVEPIRRCGFVIMVIAQLFTGWTGHGAFSAALISTGIIIFHLVSLLERRAGLAEVTIGILPAVYALGANALIRYYYNSQSPWEQLYPLIPLLLGAFLFLGTAGFHGKSRFVHYSFAMLVFLLIIYLKLDLPQCFWIVFSLILAGFGTGYCRAAEKWGYSTFGYYAGLLFTMAYGYLLSPFYPSVTTWVACLILLVVMFFLTGERYASLRHPFGMIGLILSLVSLGISVGTLDRTANIWYFGVYGLLYMAGSQVRKSTLLGYLSISILSIGWAYFLSTLPVSLHVVSISFLAFVWAGLSIILSQRKTSPWLALPFFHIALIAGAFSILCALYDARGNGVFTEVTLIINALIFGLFAWSLRRSLFAHLGYGCILLGYWLVIFDQAIRVPDAYLIPVGLYIIALGYLSFRHGNITQPQWYYGIGLFITLGSSFLTALQRGGWHDVVLITGSVAAIFFGIAQRYKVFAGLGGVSLWALLAVRTTTVLFSIHWSIFAVILGLLILGSAVYFNARLEEVRRMMGLFRSRWNEWR